MTQLIGSEEFAELLCSKRRLIDVRAPIEFQGGSIPGAVNQPILNDEERHQVGICYKQRGQDRAIELGHQLLNGETRAQRVAGWIEQVQADPEAVIFCFRGGMRSQLTQQWLAEAGYQVPIVEGGYKALRQFFLSQLEKHCLNQPMLVVGGMTGTGKTQLINQFNHHVDLEGIAHHRGSSFGRHSTPQPSQIDFENCLSARMLRLQLEQHPEWLLEDEGRMVGSVSIPTAVQKVLNESPIVVIEEHLDNRVKRLLQDYIVDLFTEYLRTHPETAFDAFQLHLQSGLARIKKRLGGQRFAEIDALMRQAFRDCRVAENAIKARPHAAWIAKLLEGYYDSMYHYQLGQKQHRVIFKGSPKAVTELIQSRLANDR